MTDATQPKMARAKALPVGILLTALFALLAFAPLASAASNPVGSGSAAVTLGGPFKKALKKKGVTILKVAPAKIKGSKVTLTVTGGSLDSATGAGTVVLGGGLKFKAGRKNAVVRALSLDTSKKVLNGKIGAKKYKIATVVGLKTTANGFGFKLTAKSLKLTGPTAGKLNALLGLKGKNKAFKANQVVGSAKGEAQPSTVAIKQAGSATLALSPIAAKKLNHVGTPPFPEGSSKVAVSLGPLAPTEQSGLNLTFPIGAEGSISPTGNAGTLKTVGGVKLIQDLSEATATPGNVTTLTMGNIWVDMGTKQASVEVTIENPKTAAANLGNLGRTSIADVNLAGATFTSDPATHTITVTNAVATLQAVTAATLNQVFIEGLEGADPTFKGQEKFAAGDPLGTFSFSVQTE
jgi:hypothetical protein